MMMPNRGKVIKAFDEAKELIWTDDDEYTVGYNNGLEAGKNIALTLLKEQEAVVRCNDCKWFKWGDSNDETVYCKLHERCHDWNWFCADGERKG